MIGWLMGRRRIISAVCLFFMGCCITAIFVMRGGIQLQPAAVLFFIAFIAVGSALMYGNWVSPARAFWLRVAASVFILLLLAITVYVAVSLYGLL